MSESIAPETQPSGRSLNGVDPMPAAALGMWLFLASEAMFFIGLLGALIVLSSGEQHELYAKSARMLSLSIAVCGVILLFASSAAIRFRANLSRWGAVGAAVLFLLLQVAQWHQLLRHHTIVYRNAAGMFVVDGDLPSKSMLTKAREINAPDHFNVHTTTPADFPQQSPARDILLSGEIRLDASYGPSRNNFFASYFVLTAAHVLHLIAGIAAVLFFMLFRNGKLPYAVQMYWHFVNATGLIIFIALYLV